MGIATNRAEKEFAGAVGMFLQGAQGDINSNFVRGPADQTLLALEMFGSRFADVICSGVKTAKVFEVTNVASVEGEEPYTLADIRDLELEAMPAEQESISASIIKSLRNATPCTRFLTCWAGRRSRPPSRMKC